MGMGTDNVYLINTDEAGKMDAAHLGNRFDMETLRFEYFKFFFGSQKVKFCALKLKVPCRSWSRLQLVSNETCFTL